MQKLCSLGLMIFLSACDVMQSRLEEVGRVPEMSKVTVYEESFDPVKAQVDAISGYQRPNKEEIKPSSSPNSLWRGDHKSFLKPYSVGDIISVVVKISDQAKLDNQTQKSRNSGTAVKAPSILGAETILNSILPNSSQADSLVNLKSNDTAVGKGNVNRKETLQTTIAVSVIKVLPSGNLLVKGSQEIRINFEIREVLIEGIVRPEDISMDNKVRLEQMSEARVSYGGRGQIFDYQQAPYGKQVLDVINPF
jgi:flagellar L-ring protein precursor FlgH